MQPGGIIASMLRLPLARREMVRIEEEATATCEAFGLGALKQLLAGSLTAGARRIVELARAAVSGPRILLLDEPSSGLSRRRSTSSADRSPASTRRDSRSCKSHMTWT